MVNSAGPGAALPKAAAERRLPGEPPRRRCCRHLAGNAFLRWVCRQDAGSTLGFMESSHDFCAVHWDHEPTPNPSQEGNCEYAEERLLSSWEGSGVGRF